MRPYDLGGTGLFNVMDLESKPREHLFAKPFEAFVTSIKGEEGMYYLRGYVRFGREDYPFRAVAFGRFGGHNVSVEFLKTAERNLKKKGFTEQEIEYLETATQVKVLQGDMTVLEQRGNGHE